MPVKKISVHITKELVERAKNECMKLSGMRSQSCVIALGVKEAVGGNCHTVSVVDGSEASLYFDNDDIKFVTLEWDDLRIAARAQRIVGDFDSCRYDAIPDVYLHGHYEEPVTDLVYYRLGRHGNDR